MVILQMKTSNFRRKRSTRFSRCGKQKNTWIFIAQDVHVVLFAIDVTLFTGRMLLFRCLQENPKASLKVDLGV